MTRAAFLKAYGRGWQLGDAGQILAAAAPGFVCEDPVAGAIARAEFPAYLDAFKARAVALRASQSASPGKVLTGELMAFSDFAVAEARDETTAWAWWRVPGTSLQGAGLIRIGDDGVRLERMTYFATPALVSSPGEAG
jgi:hypothetical protein